MAIFGFGQQDPYAEAEQAAQDRQTAFAGMKDNLPALGLIAGLSVLARNNGTRSVGQLIGQAGGDALNAYGTWRKIEDAKARQKQLDDIAREEREYGRTQDAFKNDLAMKQFALQEAKMAQDAALARQRMGAEWARINLARQAAGQAAADRAAQEEYAKTHRMGADGMPYVMRTGEDGKTYWEQDRDAMIIGKDGEVLGVKTPDPAKFADVNAWGKRYLSDSADYLNAGQHLSNLYIGAQQENAAGDLAMIFSLMKMYDPTSVVREGEQASAQNAAGVPDRIRNMYNNLLTGQRLSPNQRREFVGVARDMFKGKIGAQNTRKKMFSSYALEQGMNPDYIVQDPYTDLLGNVDEYIKRMNERAPGTGGAAPAPGAGANIPGVTGRGGPAGRAAPGVGALPPGFKIVK